MAMMMLVAMMTMMIINCTVAINRTSRMKSETPSSDRSDIGVQQFKLTWQPLALVNIVSVQRVSRNCDGDADDRVIYAEEVGGPGAGQFLCSDNWVASAAHGRTSTMMHNAIMRAQRRAQIMHDARGSDGCGWQGLIRPSCSTKPTSASDWVISKWRADIHICTSYSYIVSLVCEYHVQAHFTIFEMLTYWPFQMDIYNTDLLKLQLQPQETAKA